MFKISGLAGLGRVSLSVVVLSVSVGCVESFKALEQSESIHSADPVRGVNPWSQGRVSEAVMNAQFATNRASCSVYVPAVMSRSEELRAVVMSQEVVEVQVGVDLQAYVDLGTLNGFLTWPGNTFDAADYKLHFRGRTVDGSSVPCDPATKIVSIFPATSQPAPIPAPGPEPVTPAPVPAPSPVLAPAPTAPPESGRVVIDRNYVPLMGNSWPGSTADPITNSGFKNFREIYKPHPSLLVDMGSNGAPGEKCYLLRTRHGSNLQGIAKTRVYIPPGTKRFGVSTITYYDQVTSQAAAYRFERPPVSTYEIAGLNPEFWNADGKKNFEHIFNGKEFAGKNGPNANLMPSFGTLSGNDYLNKYLFKTSRGGWLYINFIRMIGDAPLNMDTYTCVDPVDYENWYNGAQWDQDGNPY